jgi:hypothetical protein
MNTYLQRFRAHLYQTSTNQQLEDYRKPSDTHGEQTRHFFIHTCSLVMTKIGDALVDPKLVLSWLFSQLQASSTMIGLLVPLREAGSLLPQMFIGQQVSNAKLTKIFWSLGALIQGIAVLGIASAVSFLKPVQATIAIVILLSIFAIARSYCSISYKATLGKTIIKSTRGTVSGAASAIAAAFTLVFALAIYLNWLSLSVNLVAYMCLMAGVLWLLASLFFYQLDERESSPSDAKSNLNLYRLSTLAKTFNDTQLVRFITLRGCLIATALTPPFLVLLASKSELANNFALLLIANALASLLSGFFWGRLSDSSSKNTLKYAALLACLNLTLVTLVQLIYPELVSPVFVALILFFAMIAHQGVRTGRSTHLVDMASQDKRATYTAVSNSIIGLLLIVGSVFGLIAEHFGVIAVFVSFIAMTLLAFVLSYGLEEVQQN